MSTPPVLLHSPITSLYPGTSVLPGLDIAVVWRPKAFNFDPQINPDGRETVISASLYASHEFDLTYNCLRNRTLTELEFKTLMGFWLQANGISFGFLFSNPYDSATLSSTFATTNGTDTRYTLTRQFGAGGYVGVEPIGVLDATQNFQLYVDGAAKASSDPTWGYQVDLSVPWMQQIVFNSAVPSDGVLSADMSYYYYCRFNEDRTEFQQVIFNVWENRKVTLYSKKGR